MNTSPQADTIYTMTTALADKMLKSQPAIKCAMENYYIAEF